MISVLLEPWVQYAQGPCAERCRRHLGGGRQALIESGGTHDLTTQ